MQAALVLHNFKAEAKPAIPALAKAAAVNDVSEYVGGCRVLNAIARANPATAEEVVKILLPLLRDKKRPDILRAAAASGLNGIGPAARWAAQDLGDVLEEPGASSDLRREEFTALINMGPRAAPTVPTLVRLLARSADQWELLRAVDVLAWIALRGLRLDGRVVQVPRSRFAPRGRVIIGSHLLLRDVKDRVDQEQGRILSTLKAVGPAAAPAVEPLERYLGRVSDRFLQDQALRTLDAIRK